MVATATTHSPGFLVLATVFQLSRLSVDDSLVYVRDAVHQPSHTAPAYGSNFAAAAAGDDED